MSHKRVRERNTPPLLQTDAALKYEFPSRSLIFMWLDQPPQATKKIFKRAKSRILIPTLEPI